MNTIIQNLKNPHFNCKIYYLLLSPVTFLGWRTKAKIQAFACKHWNRYPSLMHRLYWTARID